MMLNTPLTASCPARPARRLALTVLPRGVMVWYGTPAEDAGVRQLAKATEYAAPAPDRGPRAGALTALALAALGQAALLAGGGPPGIALYLAAAALAWRAA